MFMAKGWIYIWVGPSPRNLGTKITLKRRYNSDVAIGVNYDVASFSSWYAL